MTDKIIRYERYGRGFANMTPLVKSLYATFTPFGLNPNCESLEEALKQLVEASVTEALVKAGMRPATPAVAPVTEPVRVPASELWVLCPAQGHERTVNGDVVVDRPIEGFPEGLSHKQAADDITKWRVVVPLELLESGVFTQGDSGGVQFVKGRILHEGTLDEMAKELEARHGGPFIGPKDLTAASVFKDHRRTRAASVLALTDATLDGKSAAIVVGKCALDWNSYAAVIAGGSVTSRGSGAGCVVVQHPAVYGKDATTDLGPFSVAVNRLNVSAQDKCVVVLRDQGEVTATGNDVLVIAFIGDKRIDPVTLNKGDRAKIVNGNLEVTRHEKSKKSKS